MFMIVYYSFCIFQVLQVAAYMKFPVQLLKWTAFPCQRRPRLEPRASMYAKRLLKIIQMQYAMNHLKRIYVLDVTFVL